MFKNKSHDHEKVEFSDSLPRHIAIIMDGNGRWAKERGLPRLEGHRRGSQVLEDIVEFAAKIGLEHITVYAFSSENWKRPEDEIKGLINLMRLYLQTKVIKFHENNIKLNIIGDYQAFPPDVITLIQEALHLTKHNNRTTLTVALNYGSRMEILRAAKKIAAKVKTGELEIEAITEQLFSDNLWTSMIPDPEIFIRTSGEHRISNYLLWQLSYTELIFIDKYWPDFKSHDLMDAIKDYQGRNRRFGAI